ncbi:MAG: hypothetical protein Q7O66_11945 [Dehalococcoidia bacterium]|nr:hypothetical protein [Dehalococcoidia bacterium]
MAVDRHLMIIGGDIGSGPQDSVFIAPAGPEDEIGQWRESPHPLPQPLAEHTTVEVERKVFVIGGTNGRAAQRIVFSADMADGGEVGPWRPSSALLPVPLRGQSSVAIRRDVFVIGGSDEVGKPQDRVYKASLGAAGDLGLWQILGSLPRPVAYAAAARAGDTVYLIGGENEKGPVQDVYAGFAGRGGDLNWKSQGSLPKPSSRGAAFVDGDKLYYVGGRDGTTPSLETYMVTINSDGSLGDWQRWLSLPRGMIGLAAALLNGKAYLAGGFDGARFQSSLIYAPVGEPATVVLARSAPMGRRTGTLSVAIAISGLVALLSLLVVAFALIIERRH